MLFPLPVRNSVNVMPAAAAHTCSNSPDTGFRGPFRSVNVLTSAQGECPHYFFKVFEYRREELFFKIFYLTECVQPSSPYASIAANEDRVTPAARSIHKYRSGGCAEVSCSQRARRVFRNRVEVGYAQCGRLVTSEQPRGAFDVEHDRVTTSAGRVYADGFHVAQ